MVQDHFVSHCLELLAPLGAARARRMFGGHGLYLDDVFVALVAFERLYLKVDAGTQPRFAAAGCEPFVYEGKGKPISMSYWSVPAEAMDSAAEMAPWARLALQAAVAARASKVVKGARVSKAALPPPRSVNKPASRAATAAAMPAATPATAPAKRAKTGAPARAPRRTRA